MTPITDPSVISELLTAINSDGYGSERIDRIISVASVEAPGYAGDDTIVIAQSGIKQLVFLMNDTRPKGQTFQSRILNPDDLGDAANFAEYALEDDRDDIDVLADRIRGEDPIAPWMRQIQQALTSSTDLTSFSESLTALWDELDSKEFRDRMSQAVTIASLSGYLEAKTDAE
jgi:phage gp29-like protein